MNFYESVIYQIFPIGFCGAPRYNDGVYENRIKKVLDWVTHIKDIGANYIYFSPIFESSSHGYDTKDYKCIDVRLGNNDDFKEVSKNLHKNNIKVILDGVFNHVGREFWAFLDVLKNRENSLYKDWFHINFYGNSNYNDGFYYEGWEGHFELVKLNLKNPAVVDYLIECVKYWIDEFNIDGLRLDVCYSLDKDFLKKLRYETTNYKNDFVLIGELLHGDYNQFVNNDMVHSCTNYECYKGLYSSLNEMNLFEISHSLNRQFGAEQWTLYKNLHLVSFVDNHDVSRIKTILKNENHIPAAYTMMFTMPAIPCIYYGSEWGATGNKKDGDDSLRPSYEIPVENEQTVLISKLSKIHKENMALCYGTYKNIVIQNHHLIYQREHNGERILVFINLDEFNINVRLNMGVIKGVELLTQKEIDLSNEVSIDGYGVMIVLVK